MDRAGSYPPTSDGPDPALMVWALEAFLNICSESQQD
jgi:hypothetical protein